MVVTLAWGCGSTARPDSTTEPMELVRGGQKHEGGRTAHTADQGEMAEMAGMPPPVAKFHDTLAPRWHAVHGRQRMTETCAAIAQLRADADAIIAAPPPSGADAAAWSAGGKELAEAVAGLGATCKASDAAAFEPAFTRVHERFHGVMAAAGGKRDDHDGDEHGEHEHGAEAHDK